MTNRVEDGSRQEGRLTREQCVMHAMKLTRSVHINAPFLTFVAQTYYKYDSLEDIEALLEPPLEQWA